MDGSLTSASNDVTGAAGTTSTVCSVALVQAIANAAEHARASAVDISVGAGAGVLEGEVTDDGVGFDPQEASRLAGDGHFGLSAMRERVRMAGGTLHLRSRPGEG